MKEKLVIQAIIKRKDDRYLALKRLKEGNYANQWEFPGGKRFANETQLETLRREILEETALTVKIFPKKELEVVHKDNQGSIRIVLYKANYLGGEIKHPEHQGFGWFSLEELLGIQMIQPDELVKEALFFKQKQQ